YLQAENVIGNYSELSDLRGHAPDEVIKIPLKELKPFKDFDALPDSLFMTLRPEAAMQIGNNEKKLNDYKQQVQALEYMMEP
ncbi:MAG: hypothetical protein IKL80_03710, partial [Clostridia bacterium]|nr:hypothetical protein [Clostridia bacterium]